MAYPTLPTSEDFAQVPRDGRQMDTAADGLTRIRRLHPDRVAAFNLLHPFLTAANVAILEAHYGTYKDSSFSYTSPVDAVTYTVAYGARPSYKINHDRMTATVVLVQVAA